MVRQLFIGCAAAFAFITGSALAADPSMHEIYQAAEAGNFQSANTMMEQVLRDHPQSAKAHFVDAELLAKQGRIGSARAELQKAQQLQPGLSFAKPEAVNKLNSLLSARPMSPTQNFSAPANAPTNIPWGLLIVGGLLLAAIIFFIRSRNRAPTVIQAPGNGFGGPQPYGAGGFGPVPMGGGGMGSGILGSLATGAAVGAGIVAGESLVHHMLDGGRSSDQILPASANPLDNGQSQYDLGGNDFGVADDSGWGDTSGGGGDDWS